MSKERLEDLQKWLHTAVDSLVFNYKEKNYSNMMQEKQFITELLSNFN